MPYSAKAIANYFLDKADAEGAPLSPMKLQKLVYLAHGWYLAVTAAPLLDELVEAWQYGPVIPSIYHEFKEFGSGPIKGRAQDVVAEGSSIRFVTPSLEEQDVRDHPQTREILDRVWKVYSTYSAGQLSTMTHQAGTPWRKTWDDMGDTKFKNQKIENGDIEKHFMELSGASQRG